MRAPSGVVQTSANAEAAVSLERSGGGRTNGSGDLDSPVELVLADLLAGRAVEAAWDDTLSREVLLA